MHLVNKLLFIFLSFVGSLAVGQTTLNAPLSFYNLGEVSSNALSSDVSMGGASTGNYSSYMINNLNPASYSALFTQLADASFVSSSKRINLAATSARTAGGSIHNFTYAIPLGRRLGMSFGLKPLSAMNYEFENVSSIDTTKQLTQLYKGTGGINKFNLGVGYSIVRDSLNIVSIGANLNYLFGSNLKTSTASVIETGLQSYKSVIQNSFRISAVTYEFGLIYVRNISEKVDVSFGLTFRPHQKLNSTTTVLAASFTNNFSAQTIKDYVEFDESETFYNLPQQIAAGIVLDLNNKFKILADYKIQSAVDNSHLGESYNTIASNNVALGLQYVPDADNIMKILKVSRYRLGFNYGSTGKVYEGAEIVRTAGTVGIGIPLVKSQSLTSFNFGMEIGNKTTNEVNSYSELYTNVYFGVSIAPHKFDKWFVRRKID